MLEVINLEKSFKDKKVLQGINFKIEKGDIVGLIGQLDLGNQQL